MSTTEVTDLPIKRGVFVGDDFRPDHAQLRGVRCAHCDETFFPARTVCPRCQSDAITEVALARTGRVNSITAVMRPPNHYAKPYWLAEVDLPEGVRLLAQIDCPLQQQIQVGESVTLVTRPLLSLPDGKRVWGYLFAPTARKETAQ
jgi:uncharacterized protein